MDSHWKKVITDLRVPIHILNMPGAHSVACAGLVKAGTRDERWPEEAGLAHALEHMVFQGTRDFEDGTAMTAYLEDIGGALDAGTDTESTFFCNQVPAKEIRRSIYVLSQQIIHPCFNEERIKSEVEGVIIQEIRMCRDDAKDYIQELSREKTYGEHPLGRNILGTEKSVANFERRHFLNFHSYYYNANNLDFIVVGRIESEDLIIDLFNQYFAGLQDGPFNSRQLADYPGGRQHLVYECRDLGQSHVMMRALTTKGGSREATLIDVFRAMLCDGISFPLFTEVREKLGLCYEITAGHQLYEDLSNFVIYLGTDPSRYKEAVEAVFRTMHKCKNDANLLKRAQGRIEGLMALQRESPVRVLDTASSDIGLIGRARDFDEIISLINDIEISKVEAAVNKYLLTDPHEAFTFTYLLPNGMTPATQLNLGAPPVAPTGDGCI